MQTSANKAQIVSSAVIAVVVVGAIAARMGASGPKSGGEGIGFFVEVVGGLFGIMSAFILFVVWDQFNRVNTGVMREAAALDDLCEVSSFLSDRNQFNVIRGAARSYLSRVVAEEPGKLAAGNLSLTCEDLWGKLVGAVRGTTPTSPKDEIICSQMLEAMAAANTARDERLAVSRTRIPVTIIQLMVFSAVVLMVGILMLDMGEGLPSVACPALLAGILVFLLLVVKDIDNPFQGAWNVSYQPMSDVEKRLSHL